MVELALVASGVFAVGLGIFHLAVPRIFDFAVAIGRDGAPCPPLAARSVGPFRYQVRRSDVLGVSWVMSNAASYVLISIGLVDLLAGGWAAQPAGRLLFVWIAGWWWIRAGGQLIVGRRAVDWSFGGLFAVLGLVSIAAAVGVA